MFKSNKALYMILDGVVNTWDSYGLASLAKDASVRRSRTATRKRLSENIKNYIYKYWIINILYRLASLANERE